MPAIRRSYLDLSQKRRSAGAKAAREAIRAALQNATPAQVAEYQKKLRDLDLWEAGTLHTEAEPAEPLSVSDLKQKIRNLKG